MVVAEVHRFCEDGQSHRTNYVSPPPRVARSLPLSRISLTCAFLNSTSLSADAVLLSLSWGLLLKLKCRLVPSGCLLAHIQYFSSLALLSSSVTFLLSDTRTMKNMTFRRLKKLNSNEPDSGSLSHDSGDIYFTSSKSDSCTVDRGPSNSTEVYNYKTLAYSGGTLPRNFKKVRAFQFTFEIRILYLSPQLKSV